MVVHTRAPEYPPLWTWGAALALASLLFACLVAWDVRARDAYLTRYFDLARFSVASGDAPVVVAIGSSKTRCALEFDEDMDELLKQQGRKVHFIRVTRGSGTAEDLRVVFARIDEQRPSLVLIEADLLLYEPNVYRLPGAAVGDDWRRRLQRSAASVLIGDRAFGNQEPSEKFENTARSRTTGCGSGAQEPVESHLRTLATRRGSTAAERAPYLEAFKSLRARGVDVRIIDYPHSPAVEAGFPSNLRSAAEASRVAILKTGLATEFWKETPSLAKQEFLDAGHMNSSGRASFSQLFAARLAELVPR